PLLVRDLAAPVAGHHGGDAVLGDPDLCRLPAGLRHDRRRTGQRHPPVRDLRLPDRHRHRAVVGGGGDLARHVPVPVHNRGGAAPLYPPRGDPLMIEGAAWRKWVFYNIPLIIFVFVLLFPFYWMIITTFRPDGELYRPWNARNYMPFWTNHPTV